MDRNEDQMRFGTIDPLLIDPLGWRRINTRWRKQPTARWTSRQGRAGTPSLMADIKAGLEALEKRPSALLKEVSNLEKRAV